MKAFTVDRYGKKETLRATEVPEPVLGEDEVLIEVHATGVNLLDSKIRSGEFKLILPYRTPFVLGHDVAGVVARVGARVRQFKPGDEVYSRPDDFRVGTFAEFVAVKEDSVALKPRNLSMEEAASIPLVGLTAWQALVEKAQLKKGQKVFIQAGSGGVGTFAIQLAKHLGATVATTTSTGNVAWVKDLGADVVVDYKQDAGDVAGCVASRWATHLHFWTTYPSVCGRHQSPLVDQTGSARAELWHPKKSETPQRRLFIPVYEGQRKPVAANYLADRVGCHPPGHRQSLPV